MLEEEYDKALQVFSEWFGMTYSENEEFKAANKDLEMLQQIIIPTIYRTFKKITTTYSELIELCMSTEKSKKISQKREEVSQLYKQNFRFLVYITRLFLIFVQEISGLTKESGCGEQVMTSFPIKVIHELLGSPGTKECIIFLMDLALLQDNKLFSDQLFDYLVEFSNSIQKECYLLRKRLIECSNHSFDHQFLHLTNNFDSSNYYIGLTEKQESIVVILFKIRNLVKNLWKTDKSYIDLMVWWRKNYMEIVNSISNIQLSELYDQLESTKIDNLAFLTYFEYNEYWELSTLFGITGYILYITYQAIIDGNEQVEEAVTLFHFKNHGYSVSQLVNEAIKYSIISILLDPANYKATWVLSLLHLLPTEHFSLKYSLKFTRQTIHLNPSFEDSWVLYSLLWTNNFKQNSSLLLPTDDISESTFSEKTKDQGPNSICLEKISPISFTCKIISLVPKGANLEIPLKFIYIGYNVFQILADREDNDDLCYGVLSYILELDQWISQKQASQKEREAEFERSPSMSNVSVSPSNKSKKNKEYRSSYSDQALKPPSELESDSSPLISYPILFRLQLLIWSIKLKQFLSDDGIHICTEFITNQLNDFQSLEKKTLEKDLDILDELQINTHVKSIIKMLINQFSTLFNHYKTQKSSLTETSHYSNGMEYGEFLEKIIFSQNQTQPGLLFETDLIDWRIVLSPIHNLY